MIKISSKGNYNKARRYLKELKSIDANAIFKRYGEAGVAALAAATPVNTGLTASSWGYTIENDGKKTAIHFYNNNVVDEWCNIAIILQYGHATGSGGYVEGIDYINPAVRGIFNRMAQELWMEVTAL